MHQPDTHPLIVTTCFQNCYYKTLIALNPNLVKICYIFLNVRNCQ